MIVDSLPPGAWQGVLSVIRGSSPAISSFAAEEVTGYSPSCIFSHQISLLLRLTALHL